MRQSNGYKAVQKIMQKIMALLNWLSFIREIYFDEPARHKDSQRTMPAYTLAPMGVSKK